MKNFKKLTREELKSINGGLALDGGGSCSVAIQGADGSWVTRTGTCKKLITASMGDSPADMIGQYMTASYYCETGLGAINITSNNGVSRCN
jgi:lactobin A/cerein 7B family class IIb bacteriocin